nr:reverse transcriptase domain-containing protein [Tanacetum cinerariifolium]
MPRECLAIIESKSKLRYSCNKPVVAKVSMNTSTSGISPDVAKLKDMVKAILLDKKSQNQALATVKAVEESCLSSSDDVKSNSTFWFPPVRNNQNVQRNQRNNQNRFNQNQNRGNNFNHGPVYQPLVFQPPAYQAPTYQAPAPQTQGVSKENFSAYVKANDAIMRNMQTQGQNMQNQLTNMTELLNKFMKSNSASTSSSSTLTSNTIANPRSDLKAITTRSGVSYDGPQSLPPPSFLPKVVENEPKATKDTVHPTNNGSTEDVQPPVVQSESLILTSKPVNSIIIEPVASPFSALRPNQRPLIPYPSRLQDQKLRDKANDQREKFFQIFKDLNFNISFADALILMPLSMWNKLSIPNLSPMCMTLELVDRSISRPVGLKKMSMSKRSFLKTERALIDVFEGELTLRVGKEAITFNLDQTSRYSANYNDMMAKRIDNIDMACEEYSKEVLSFSNVIASGKPTPYYDLIVSTTSLTLTPFENRDFLLKDVDAFLSLEDDHTSPEVDQSYLDSEEDILLLEAFLNDDSSLPPLNHGNYLPEVRKELKIYEAKSDKSSIDEPLKRLAGNQYYCFLDGFSGYFQIPINLKDQEKTTFTYPYGTFAYRRMPFGLCNASGTFQRCMMAIFYDMIEKTMEVFMDDFSVFGNSFQSFLSHLEKMLKRCEDTNLCLN